jgi:hypothetical protein
MTFKESMIKLMVSRGMFESQAKKIMEEYITSVETNPMMDRWDEDVSGYPENLQVVLWMGVKDYAAGWISTNLPQAWFRPMFQYSESELSQMSNAKRLN